MPDISKMSSPEERTFKTFERLVSRHRLRRYRRETASKQEAVGLYLWNIALCESLYPALHFFEVALRNATHQAISECFHGNFRWFTDMTILTEERHQRQILEAIQELRKQNKDHFLGEETDREFPKEPQRIVAALPIGFWVNLYSNPYTSSLVVPIAATVFPNGPKEVVKDKRQDVIYPRLREALDLRNRVFHHEPIYHWTLGIGANTLVERYNRLREVITWMCEVQPFFLEAVDSFMAVHNEGRKPYIEAAEFAFLRDEEQEGN